MATNHARSRSLFATSIAALLCYTLYQFHVGHLVISYTKLLQPWKELLGGEFRCEKPSYTVRILSHDPLMIHVEDLITPVERRHLLDVAAPLLQRSKVAAKNGSEIFSPQRSSSSAYMPSDDPVAKCIYSRVSEFQGYEPLQNMESLQVTSYRETQQYKPHFDWFGPKANITKDRVTTFFSILEADCDNCGTNFPELPISWEGQDERWCRIVDCSAESLTVLPVPGSALFWRNLHMDGSGDRRTKHAGLPLARGMKTGLNIWTTQEME